MTQTLSRSKESSIERDNEMHSSTFADDVVRAAFPWVLIITSASVIAVAIGLIGPAIEYHARNELNATMAIICGGVAIVAIAVFVHLFVTFYANRLKRKS